MPGDVLRKFVWHKDNGPLIVDHWRLVTWYMHASPGQAAVTVIVQILDTLTEGAAKGTRRKNIDRRGPLERGTRNVTGP